MKSALSPKPSSPAKEVGGSALEPSEAGGGGGWFNVDDDDGPGSDDDDAAAAAALFALSLWLRLRSTGPAAEVLASGWSGGLVVVLVAERQPPEPEVTPVSAASIPLGGEPLNIRPETRGRK